MWALRLEALERELYAFGESPAVSRAREQTGIERILLMATMNQPAARQLYLSLGFESFGCERHALKVGDVYVDEEHMVLPLT